MYEVVFTAMELFSILIVVVVSWFCVFVRSQNYVSKGIKISLVWIKEESVKAYLIWNCQRIEINIYWVPIMSRAWIGRYEENKAS